jgi:hypothetical protein
VLLFFFFIIIAYSSSLTFFFLALSGMLLRSFTRETPSVLLSDCPYRSSICRMLLLSGASFNRGSFPTTGE